MIHKLHRMAFSLLVIVFVLTVQCMSMGEGIDTGNAMVKQYLTVFVQGVEELFIEDFDTLNAWIGVERITLRDCDTGSQAAIFVGPFAVDLSVVNELGTVESSRTSVCGATVQLQPFEDEEDIAFAGPLHDLSLFASGVNTHGTFFEIRSQEALSVDIPLAPLDLQPGNNDIALQIAVASWLEGIDLETAEQIEGTVLIDDEHNQTFLEIIHQNFLQTMRMGHSRGGFIRSRLSP